MNISKNYISELLVFEEFNDDVGSDFFLSFNNP